MAERGGRERERGAHEVRNGATKDSGLGQGSWEGGMVLTFTVSSFGVMLLLLLLLPELLLRLLLLFMMTVVGVGFYEGEEKGYEEGGTEA